MPPTPMQNTGFIPSPPDTRDYLLEDAQPVAAGQVPSFFKTDLGALPVLNQGKQPSCVAHAVTYYNMYLIWKKTGRVVLLSPRFLYALCKANDGLPATEGTFFRVALKMAQKYGICEDSFHPNDVNMDKNVYKDASLISAVAYANAQQYKIGNYYQIKDASYMGLFRAAFQNAMCIIGMRISSEWWQREDGTISWDADDLMPLRPPDAAHPIVSGHAVNIYASGLNLQYIINWWSSSWGYKGHGWYGKNDIPYIFEAWVIADLPKSTAQPVQAPTLSQDAPWSTAARLLQVSPLKNTYMSDFFKHHIVQGLVTAVLFLIPLIINLNAPWEQLTLGGLLTMGYQWLIKAAV